MLAFLRAESEVVPITGTLKMCRDPKDDMLIETVLVGHAAVLVTEDQDLLVLALPNCRTVRILDFERWIDSERP